MDERKSKPGSVRKKVFRIIMAVLVVLAVKIIVTILSQPKASTDYVAKINELTKPANYDPKDDASPYYQKALILLVEKPSELYQKNAMSTMALYNICWPDEIDPNTFNVIREWVTENQPALKQARLAVEKPYYWLKLKTKEEEKHNSETRHPDLREISRISTSMLWHALINAYDGNDEDAFSDIITVYRMGIHKCGTPSLIMEQSMGLSLKKKSIDATIVILANKKVDDDLLKSFKKKIESLSEKTYMDLRAETLQTKELVEVSFARNLLGQDRLAFSKYRCFQCMGGLPPGRWKNCFWGPTRAETMTLIDNLMSLHEPLNGKTMWEFKNTFAEHIQQIDELTYNHFLTQTYYPCYITQLERIQQTQSYFNGLITILSLLLYKSENGSYPETLDALVEAGLLNNVPIDPYSNKGLGYLLSDDDFKLYSIGTDFEDNKAEIFEKTLSYPMGLLKKMLPGSPLSFRNSTNIWPKISRTYKDIVYWPVTGPDQIRTERKNNWKKRDFPHEMF
jgi:hypothetical protein